MPLKFNEDRDIVMMVGGFLDNDAVWEDPAPGPWLEIHGVQYRVDGGGGITYLRIVEDFEMPTNGITEMFRAAGFMIRIRKWFPRDGYLYGLFVEDS